MAVFNSQVEAALARVRTSDHTHDDVQLLERALLNLGWLSPDTEAYAVYSPESGWLEDTCAGGAFSDRVANAIWFQSKARAIEVLKEAEIIGENGRRFFVLRVQ